MSAGLIVAGAIVAGLAVGLAIGVSHTDAKWIQPAAQMLWVEQRGAVETGSPGVEAASALFRRAHLAGATPDDIVRGFRVSGADGSWNPGDAYQQAYRTAPVLPRYKAEAWAAFLATAGGRRGDERHFTHGNRPNPDWIRFGFEARAAGTVGGRTLYMYRMGDA